MKECEITVDRHIVGFWVTIAIILTILKLMTPLQFSWVWVLISISMPFMIVVGVIIVMALYNVNVKIQSRIRQKWNYRKYRGTNGDTSNR